MTTLKEIEPKAKEVVAKRAALVTRVSTDQQARNVEGSLVNQIQRLRQHIDYKTNACGENWTEAAVYELKGISGKNSMRSKEFERLFADIAAGRVNTVLCTALDRICRSVKDFLWFFEFLHDHNAEFVCLKQNYDTTSSQGRLFVTMMMALAEFEREQTSERTRDAVAARSERGLWNGGRLLGYDTDPNKKSTLIPNPAEAAIVNFAFDKYLECGSITETSDAMNGSGYRTKSYSSRRDVYHPGERFYVSTIQYLLKNPAYAGKKEINKQSLHKKITGVKEYRLVDAVWPAIVSIEKFENVQHLMAENGQTNRNAAEPVRHVYVLSQGILRCGRCGTVMDGRSGTGRLGIKYFYYGCPNKECGIRISADEIEAAVLNRIKYLASDGAILEKLTQETNMRLLKQKPELEKQKQGLQKTLEEVIGQANNLLEHWSAMDAQAGGGFVKEKLNNLAKRRTELETGITEVDEALRQITEQSVDAETVKSALTNISEIYEQLKPFERRELIGLILKSAEVNEKEIILEIYALGEQILSPESVKQSEKVRLPPIWLPLLDLFSNYKVELGLNLTQLKRAFQSFNMPQITNATALGGDL